jgi:hypothetical protein
VHPKAIRAFLLAAFAALAGCQTTPPSAVKEVGPDTYQIHYTAGRHGAKMAPEDRVLLLAAQTTLEHKAKYFALVGFGDETPPGAGSSTDSAAGAAIPAGATPGIAQQNVYGIYGVGGTSPLQPLTSQIASSKKGVTIKCFVVKPEDLIVSNAAAVESDIKKKYALP